MSLLMEALKRAELDKKSKLLNDSNSELSICEPSTMSAQSSDSTFSGSSSSDELRLHDLSYSLTESEDQALSKEIHSDSKKNDHLIHNASGGIDERAAAKQLIQASRRKKSSIVKLTIGALTASFMLFTIVVSFLLVEQTNQQMMATVRPTSTENAELPTSAIESETTATGSTTEDTADYLHVIGNIKQEDSQTAVIIGSLTTVRTEEGIDELSTADSDFIGANLIHEINPLNEASYQSTDNLDSVNLSTLEESSIDNIEGITKETLDKPATTSEVISEVDILDPTMQVSEISVRRTSRPQERLSQLADLNLRLQQNDLISAIEILSDLLYKQPNDIEVLMLYGSTLLRKGDIKSAAEFFDRAIIIDPSNETARALHLMTISDLSSDGRVNELRRLHAQNPMNHFLTHELGKALALIGDWQEASYFFRQALDTALSKSAISGINPDYPYNLAVSLEQVGMHEAAIDYYRDAINYARLNIHSFDLEQAHQRVRTLSDR